MPAWIIPAAIAAGQLIGNLVGQHKQNKYDRQMAAFQADKDKYFLEKQNEYNSPMAQMARFSQAGLNPHLVYGQGNPGNQSEAQHYPDVKSRGDWSTMGTATSGAFNQAMLMQSQTAAINQKVIQSGAQTELIRAQTELAKNQPLVNGALQPVLEQIRNQASISQSQGIISKYQSEIAPIMGNYQIEKIIKEIDNLERQFKLQGLDEQIKAEIIKSKEFQNAMDGMMKKFMVDGDFGPSQWYQLGFQLLRLVKPR